MIASRHWRNQVCPKYELEASDLKSKQATTTTNTANVFSRDLRLRADAALLKKEATARTSSSV